MLNCHWDPCPTTQKPSCKLPGLVSPFWATHPTLLHWASCSLLYRMGPPALFLPHWGCLVIREPPAQLYTPWGRLSYYLHTGAACPVIFAVEPGRLSYYIHIGASCPGILTLGPLALLYSCWTACSIILTPGLPALLRLGPPALLHSHRGRQPTILTLGPLALLYSHWGCLPCCTHTGTVCSLILAPGLPTLLHMPLGPPALLHSH